MADRHEGYRRLLVRLRAEGWQVNHKRLRRILREDNLLALRQQAFVPPTTDSRHTWHVCANLARGLVTTGVNQLWVADITYIRLQEEFVYLAVVLDAHSRKVIGWAMARHLQASLAVAALRRALASRTVPPGLIHHSDRGVQGGFNRSSQHLQFEELPCGYTKAWSLSTWYPTGAWIDRLPTGRFEGRTASVLAGHRAGTVHRNLCRKG